MMGRPHDPALAMRERLKALETRERARTEARAVAAGVAETVALGEARGVAFEAPAVVVVAGRAQPKPYRRQAGLEWLAGKNRITARQRAAGERYGEAWRRAGAMPTIGSALEMSPGSNLAAGPSLGQLLRMAEGRRQAQARLDRFRVRLFGQGDLVKVCDLVCGQELTPREAGVGERDALRVEAVLKVALDLLGLAD